MVRAARIWPDVYFGRPGALVKLPYPRGDVDRSFEKMVFDFVTGTGQHQVSTMIGGSRQYAISWNALQMDTYRLIEQYWLGHMGAGPWAYIDPSMGNMLLPNQSSCTNVFFDTRNFAVTSGALSSNATASQIHRVGATRSLRWLWSSAPAAGTQILSLDAPYRNWFGYPVMPGLSYAFSGWVKPDGTVETNITASIRMTWLNATGGQISTTDSASIANTTWTQHSAVGVAPAGAVYVKPMVLVTGSTVVAGGSLYVDELQLEQDTVVNTWAPGTGLRPVEVLALNETVPFDARFRKGIAMTLRELAP